MKANKKELHTQLQEAYKFFNEHLFNNRLPPCVITVQRDKDSSRGYFYPARFGQQNNNDKFTDEIAINPIYFINAKLHNVLSTLVHEMVHLEQHHLGHPTRGRYHNREWGQWMQRVGLMPSKTGQVGGKQTGDQMTHYIIKGGAFDVACHELIKNNFTLEYYDRHVFFSKDWIKQSALKPINYGQPLDTEEIIKTPQHKAGEALKEILTGNYTPATTSGLALAVKPAPKRNKSTYICPECDNKVWGKPNIKITCTDCKTAFVQAT